jgi:hypothetical protein
MIKITQRPVFESEKQEYLRTLIPVPARPSVKLVWYYFSHGILLIAVGISFISRILQAVLRIPKAAAIIAGLAIAFGLPLYIRLRAKRRRQAFYEKERARLDASVIETFEMDILRGWRLAESSCSSMAYLLQASDAEFVFLETMGHGNMYLKEFPSRRLTVERDRDTREIWWIMNEGPPVIVEELEDVLAEDMPGYGCSDFAILTLDELPEALRAKIGAL